MEGMGWWGGEINKQQCVRIFFLQLGFQRCTGCGAAMLQPLDAASRFYDNEHHGCLLMACGPRYELTYFAEQTSNTQRFIRYILHIQGICFLR